MSPFFPFFREGGGDGGIAFEDMAGPGMRRVEDQHQIFFLDHGAALIPAR